MVRAMAWRRNNTMCGGVEEPIGVVVTDVTRDDCEVYNKKISEKKVWSMKSKRYDEKVCGMRRRYVV